MNQHTNIKAAIAYDDLRQWLAHAERLGEVRNVSGANWQEDIGLAAEARYAAGSWTARTRCL